MKYLFLLILTACNGFPTTIKKGDYWKSNGMLCKNIEYTKYSVNLIDCTDFNGNCKKLKIINAVNITKYKVE